MSTVCRRNRKLLIVVLAWVLGLPMSSPGWTRGNHAGDWTKGGKIKIKVDTPPGDAAQQAAYLAALDEAMKEWNDAQAAFGGLTLELTTDANPDVHIGWKDKHTSWGTTSPGKNPVELTIESDDGINARGVTRTLKHELGHVEGLGHSADSALMKGDAYSSTPGQAPSAADLNSDDPFIAPTADDLAGKKEMWGTVAKKSTSSVTDNASFNGSHWEYRYTLVGLEKIGLVDPVTRFVLELPTGSDPSSFTVSAMPQGWQSRFLKGAVDPGGKSLDPNEAPASSLLVFSAATSEAGIFPGQTGNFALTSPLGPTASRSYTNSPSYDSNEASVSVPAPTVTPTPVENAVGILSCLPAGLPLILTVFLAGFMLKGYNDN